MFHVYWPVIALVAAVLLVSLLRFLFKLYDYWCTPGLVTFSDIIDIQFEGCQPRIGG